MTTILGTGYALIHNHCADAPTICSYCNDAGEIETDNNGPIVPCPVCSETSQPPNSKEAT
jgi:hypothetical protein